MKYYLTMMVFGALAVSVISMSDLSIADSVVERMERVGRGNMEVQAVAVADLSLIHI